MECAIYELVENATTDAGETSTVVVSVLADDVVAVRVAADGTGPVAVARASGPIRHHYIDTRG